MKDYICSKCGKNIPYLINHFCQDCFDVGVDHLLDEQYERLIREAERLVRRGEGDTINLIKREARG